MMESKGFLFTVVPIMVIIVVFGYLNVQQERSSNVEDLNQQDLCKNIEYNGEDRIDILFISSEEEATHYTEVLLNTEPYKSKRNYFNTRFIDQDVECKDYKGIAILCNTKEVLDLAKKCPNDYIVVVKEEPTKIRSSASGNVLSINKVHEDSVLIHEIGHAFGNLAEEYEGAKIPSGSLNCLSECNKFNRPIDSCEIGCSDGEHVRSIPVGVMRSLVTSNYGIYNTFLIDKLLEKNKPETSQLTGRQISDQETCDKNIIPVSIDQTSDQIIATTDYVIEKGCLPDKSGAGYLCFNDLCYPDVVFTDSQDTNQETLEGETITYQNTVFYIEQNNAEPLVQITLNGELINTINTAQAGATACLI